jgi:hypothetical protein
MKRRKTLHDTPPARLARLPRILTPDDRRLHILRWGAEFSSDESRELMADLATVLSNQYHDCYTGHKEFYPDTPEWVIALAERRGWHNREVARILQERAYANRQ